MDLQHDWPLRIKRSKIKCSSMWSFACFLILYNVSISTNPIACCSVCPHRDPIHPAIVTPWCGNTVVGGSRSRKFLLCVSFFFLLSSCRLHLQEHCRDLTHRYFQDRRIRGIQCLNPTIPQTAVFRSAQQWNIGFKCWFCSGKTSYWWFTKMLRRFA